MPPSYQVTRRALTGSLIGAMMPDLGLSGATSVAISAADISYLMADVARKSPGLSVDESHLKQQPKRFWVEQWREPAQSFEWPVEVSEAGDYETTLMVSAPAGTKFQVTASKSSVEATMLYQGEASGRRPYNWDRLGVPHPLTLPAGKSTVRIQLDQPVGGRFGAALKSLELLNMKSRPAIDRRIREFRADTTWLPDAKYGFMCQAGEWSYPEHGPKKQWPEMAEAFDVPRFVDLVDSTGAGYVVWSATWATYYFPAPIAAIDKILRGRTSKRDLIGDLADALAQRNIRLILYYHLGHETRYDHGAWWSRNWVAPDDRARFFGNWCAIMTEVGLRYGKRLAGWMYDDELVYYPAPYEELGKAAKAGYAGRLISYNPWIQPRGTDFQDFQFGEGYSGIRRAPGGPHGVWQDGPMKGLQAHGNFQVDGPDWGINKADTTIQDPVFTAEKAQELALRAADQNVALSWNLLMYEDGSVSPRSLEVLQKAGAAVRAKYPRLHRSE